VSAFCFGIHVLAADFASRREYVEALEKEMQHKRQQVTLATMITEAKAVVGRFAALCGSTANTLCAAR
jgi:hypothetical protein